MDISLIIKYIWINRMYIFFITFLLITTLLFRQCNETKRYKDEVVRVKSIAEQNIAALGDKEIQLKVTTDQLKIIDSSLYIAKQKIDSLTDIKSKEITKVEFEYLPKNVITSSKLVYDTTRNAYGLVFNTDDLVRTIDGVSYFRIDSGDNNLVIFPDSTIIKNFSLNFSLVISQYDDPITKYTRTKIIPFYVNADQTLGQSIPESVLKLDFRNAEILDIPYQTKPLTSNKRKRQDGIALTVNPLAIGVYSTPNGVRFGLTPNIGIGYYITFKK